MNTNYEIQYCDIKLSEDVIEIVDQYKSGLITVTELVVKLQSEHGLSVQDIKGDKVIIQIPVNAQFVSAVINVSV